MEVQSGMVCARGIVTQSQKPRSHCALQSRCFMRPVVRQQEVCSARFTCLKRNNLVNWTCTVTAQLDAYVPTDRRRQSTPSGITFLVDPGTAEQLKR